MKQLSLYIILLLLAVACYDDLGNYDYTELNSVTGRQHSIQLV